MSFPVAHKYMSIIGDPYGSTERWQFGLRLAGATGTNESVALASQLASPDLEAREAETRDIQAREAEVGDAEARDVGALDVGTREADRPKAP